MQNLLQGNFTTSGSAIQQASQRYSTRVMKHKETTLEKHIYWHRSTYCMDKVKINCHMKSNVFSVFNSI